MFDALRGDTVVLRRRVKVRQHFGRRLFIDVPGLADADRPRGKELGPLRALQHDPALRRKMVPAAAWLDNARRQVEDERVGVVLGRPGLRGRLDDGIAGPRLQLLDGSFQQGN